MSGVTIKYLMNCPICGNDFYAKRKHANTCSARCRSILYHLNIDVKSYCNLIEIDLIKMNNRQIKEKAEFIRDKIMLDAYGNPFDFIDGYMNSNGEIIRVVFRNPLLGYIEAWNLVDDEIQERVYKFK